MGAHVMLIGSAPIPATGEGDITVDADGIEIIFVWSANEIVDVKPFSGVDFAQKYAKLTMTDSDGGPLMNWCCVQDAETGTYICWQVRLDTGCP